MARPEVLAFLQDSKAHPEDDTPRLILADWLTDHDDPRGEFVHLQCRLAAMQQTAPGWAELRQREQELQTRHQSDWLGPLRPLVRFWQFRRGLLEITVEADSLPRPSFAALAESEALAWVERLKVTGLGLDLERLAVCRLLRQVTTLDLSDELVTAHGARTLADLAEWGAVQGLVLNNTQLTDYGLHPLAKAPRLPELRSLELSRNELGYGGVWSLTMSTRLGQLRHLDLSGNRIGNSGVAELARARRLPRLSAVDLGSNRIEDEGVRALAAARHLLDLGTLILSDNRIGDAGAWALATSTRLWQLRHLDLAGNRITDDGAQALVSSLYLGQLRRLRLEGNRFSDEGGRLLRERFGSVVSV
jgi:uncharacterized protein (TIGR02996 family)